MPANQSPCCYYNDTEPNFLGELVSSGLLSSNPHDPQSPSRFYWYYNYGGDPCSGYYVGAYLEDESQNPDLSALSTNCPYPPYWNAPHNGDCKPNSTYCVYGHNT